MNLEGECSEHIISHKIWWSQCKSTVLFWIKQLGKSRLHGTDSIGMYCICKIFCYHFVGTTHAAQWPCPLGTYSNVTGLSLSTDCNPCPGGFYCGLVGQDKPTGMCDQGYYCKRSAISSTPNQTDDANICPQGEQEKWPDTSFVFLTREHTNYLIFNTFASYYE